MSKYEIKKEITEMALRCYGEKLFACTSGNLSVYDAETGEMYITPSSYPYEDMTPDDIVVIKLNGDVVETPHNPSSEWRMHAVVYKNMPEVRALVHTHSPYATSFAVNHLAIPAILIEMVPFLGGDVPLAEFAIPGTEAVGENAVAVLGDRNACLMANHGVLAVGGSLEQAHTRAVYVEDAAKICAIAKASGETVYCIGEENIEFMSNGKRRA